MPGPAKESTDAMRACRSALDSAVEWPEEGEVRGVGRYATAAFSDESSALLNGMGQVCPAIESVHAMRERVAAWQICGSGGAYGAAGY